MIVRALVLPLRPDYLAAMLRGEKRWEFRRRPLPVTEPMLVYATAPASRIEALLWLNNDVPRSGDAIDLVAGIGAEAGVSATQLEAIYGEYTRLYAHRVGYILPLGCLPRSPGRAPSPRPRVVTPPQTTGRIRLQMSEEWLLILRSWGLSITEEAT